MLVEDLRFALAAKFRQGRYVSCTGSHDDREFPAFMPLCGDPCHEFLSLEAQAQMACLAEFTSGGYGSKITWPHAWNVLFC